MSSKINRQCSFCLIDIPAPEVKVCSKCHRRAYCGVECQKKDWKSKTGDNQGEIGQGHKDWCSLNCGEEGLDWEVKLIEGKGKGVFAKKRIPAGFRIMVEGMSSTIQSQVAQGRSTLRVTVQINHACWSNSHRTVDQDFQADIIQAKKDIEIGEEITLNYTCLPDLCKPIKNQMRQFYDKEFYENFEDTRIVLARRYKITCPANCFCLKGESAKKLKKLMGLTSKVETAMKRGDPKFDFTIVDKLLEEMGLFNASTTGITSVMDQAIVLACGNSEGARAIKYGEECRQLLSLNYHPKSRNVVGLTKILETLKKKENLVA